MLSAKWSAYLDQVSDVSGVCMLCDLGYDTGGTNTWQCAGSISHVCVYGVCAHATTRLCV